MDSYLQLNAAEIGFKFRGALENDVGSLECKVRKQGESPNPENWVKFQVARTSAAQKEPLVQLLQSYDDSLPVSICTTLESFDLNRDVIHCDKHRVNRMMNESTIKQLNLQSHSLSFNGIFIEFASFTLQRRSGEHLGKFSSLNVEGGTAEKLLAVSSSLLNFIDYSEPIYTMGYPEFIMKVSNGDI